MASDWLAAVLPVDQMPGLKIFVNLHAFLHGNVLVTQAPGNYVLCGLINAHIVWMFVLVCLIKLYRYSQNTHLYYIISSIIIIIIIIIIIVFIIINFLYHNQHFCY